MADEQKTGRPPPGVEGCEPEFFGDRLLYWRDPDGVLHEPWAEEGGWEPIEGAPADREVVLKRDGEWRDARAVRHKSGAWIMTTTPMRLEPGAPAPLGPPTHWRRAVENRWSRSRVEGSGSPVMKAVREAAMLSPAGDAAPEVVAGDAEVWPRFHGSVNGLLAGMAERMTRHTLEGLILERPPWLPPPTVDECVLFARDPDGQSVEIRARSEYGAELVERYKAIGKDGN